MKGTETLFGITFSGARSLGTNKRNVKPFFPALKKHTVFYDILLIIIFRTLSKIKERENLDLRFLSDTFMEFIDERTIGTECFQWQRKFKQRQQRITRKVLRIAKKL